MPGRPWLAGPHLVNLVHTPSRSFGFTIETSVPETICTSTCAACACPTASIGRHAAPCGSCRAPGCLGAQSLALGQHNSTLVFTQTLDHNLTFDSRDAHLRASSCDLAPFGHCYLHSLADGSLKVFFVLQTQPALKTPVRSVEDVLQQRRCSSGAAMAEAAEEHYILRVKPPALAAKLRGWLREQQGLDGRAELLFEGRADVTARPSCDCTLCHKSCWRCPHHSII